MSDVDAANKSKRAAERRRQRILAKSQARMSVVSGQGNIDSVNGENNSEKKPRRRRRQRPSFMTNSLESTSSAISSNDNVDNEESLSSIKLEKTETEKGNKMPATANVVDSDKVKEEKKEKNSDNVDDEADVKFLRQETWTASRSATFSSSFRRRARKKRVNEEEKESDENNDNKSNNTSSSVSKETSSAARSSVMNRKKNYEKFNKTEEFCCTWIQVLFAFIVLNILIVTKIADLQDGQESNNNNNNNIDNREQQPFGVLIYSAMESFPIQNIGFAIIFLRLVVQTLFYILRIRYFPMLSVESSDNAGSIASIVQLMNHLRGILDDICVFIFSFVVFCILVQRFDMINVYTTSS